MNDYQRDYVLSAEGKDGKKTLYIVLIVKNDKGNTSNYILTAESIGIE